MADDNKKVADMMYSEEEFLAVPTSSLIHRKSALSDLYIKMPTGRMIKLAHRGGSIDVERINRLGSKNVQYLYVHRIDFGMLVAELVRGAEKINEVQQIPGDIKLAKFFNISESVFTELIKLPLSDDSMSHAIRISAEISTSLKTKPDFAKAVEVLMTVGEDFSKHSLATVIVVSMMMEAMEWTSEKMITTMTQAAFFHDIGFKELPKGLFEKKRIEMTREEVELYETHPTRSVQILSSLNFISADVLRTVAEHHEIPNGQGFPGRIRGERIYPLARLLSFSNYLSHELFDSLKQGDNFDPYEVFSRIETTYGTMFGADLMKFARKIFKKP